MARGLAIIGDFYHPEAGIRDLFQGEELGLNWDYRTDPMEAPWAALGGYDLLLLSAENRVEPQVSTKTWMDEETEKRIVAFVEGGGSLIAFHSGLASYPEDGAYARLAGGTFQFHPKKHPEFDFIPADADHPLLRGVGRFSVRDEQYFVGRETDSTILLGKVESARYGSSSAFWCAERGKGRVVGLTIGHRPETLAHPSLHTLALNSLRWCLRMGA